MTEKILTLFGEEVFAEPVKTAIRSKAIKNMEEEDRVDTRFLPHIPGLITENIDTAPATPTTPPLPSPKGIEVIDSKPLTESIDLIEVAAIETPELPELNKQYYSIGEVATLFKVKTSNIRFWTNEFKLKVRTNRKGDRLYTKEQINELRNINHLVKERGFKISGAKSKLKEDKKLNVTPFDLKQSLTQLRNNLLAIRDQL